MLPSMPAFHQSQNMFTLHTHSVRSSINQLFISLDLLKQKLSQDIHSHSDGGGEAGGGHRGRSREVGESKHTVPDYLQQLLVKHGEWVAAFLLTRSAQNPVRRAKFHTAPSPFDATHTSSSVFGSCIFPTVTTPFVWHSLLTKSNSIMSNKLH